MTTDFHVVFPSGTAANAVEVESRFASLDAGIGDAMSFAVANNAELVAARSSYPSLDARLDALIVAGGNIATNASGVSAAGQKVLTVDATTGFIVGSYVVYLLNNATLEGNVIASIQAGVSLTMVNNIGATPAGGVLDDTPVSMISISEYLAAQAIPHAGTLLLPDTMAYVNNGVFKTAAYLASAAASAAVNTAAIQAALDAATSGGVVDLPPGNINFTKLVISNENVALRGHASGTTLISDTAPTGNTDPLIWVKANGCVCRDFSMTWSSMPTAVVAANPINENSVISVGWSEIIGGTSTLIEDVLVENVSIIGGKCHGIAVGRTHGVTVQNCKVRNVYGTGIWTYYACDLKIQSNNVRETGDDAIYIAANGADAYGPDDYSIGVIVTNNHIKDAGAKGIGTGGTHGCVISDNTIDNTWAEGIMAKGDPVYGHTAPSDTIISGNVLRNIFAYYGAGTPHADDIVAMVFGTFAAIEVETLDNVVISSNIVHDVSGLTAYYRGIWANGPNVIVSGNNLVVDWDTALFIGQDAVSAPDRVLSLSMTGNIVKITANNGTGALYLYGVASGVVTGNIIDCGAGTQSPPGGRFAVGYYTTNVLITGNRISNMTQEFVDAGNCSNVKVNNNSGPLTSVAESSTAAQFLSVTSTVNTVDKYITKAVWEVDTNRFLYAAANVAAAVWLDATGATARVPS